MDLGDLLSVCGICFRDLWILSGLGGVWWNMLQGPWTMKFILGTVVGGGQTKGARRVEILGRNFGSIESKGEFSKPKLIFTLFLLSGKKKKKKKI